MATPCWIYSIDSHNQNQEKYIFVYIRYMSARILLWFKCFCSRNTIYIYILPSNWSFVYSIIEQRRTIYTFALLTTAMYCFWFKQLFKFDERNAFEIKNLTARGKEKMHFDIQHEAFFHIKFLCVAKLFCCFMLSYHKLSQFGR